MKIVLLLLAMSVSPLASQQLTEAQFTAQVNAAIQPLLNLSPGKPVIMGANLEFAHGLGIPKISTTSLLEYADGLKAAGVQRIEFNPGYLSLEDPSVMAKYDALVQHIRQLGLQLAINVEYIQSQQPVTGFQQFQAAAVTGAAEIAARYQPDNFVIVHEPDTMASRMGIPNTVQDWDRFIRAVAPLVRKSSPHTRLGAGAFYGIATQAASNSENAYFMDFTTIPDLDFLTMDIYNDNTFSQYQTWAQLARAAGKGVYIEETWLPHYFAKGLPADWASEGLDNTATVGPTSADFSSLYAPWLHAMALFASENGLEAVTAFTTPAFFQYGSAGSDRPEQTAYANSAAAAIGKGQLTATGQAYLTTSRQLGIKMASSLSSASYATLSSVFNHNCGSASNPCNADSTVAPDELVSAFGASLATTSASSHSVGFSTNLAGTTATLVDSANTSFKVPLVFVSPGQLNYMVPTAARPGAATMTVTEAGGTSTTSVVLIAPVDPGLYAASSNGKGVPAGFVVCSGTCSGWGNRDASGQFVQDLYTCDTSGVCTPERIRLGSAGDTVVLELFGTGFRHVASPAAVTARINGQSLPVQFAGAQGQFTGEDQINVKLPHNLSASGMVNLVLTTNVNKGDLPLFDTDITPSSNTVTLDIQ